MLPKAAIGKMDKMATMKTHVRIHFFADTDADAEGHDDAGDAEYFPKRKDVERSDDANDDVEGVSAPEAVVVKGVLDAKPFGGIGQFTGMNAAGRSLARDETFSREIGRSSEDVGINTLLQFEKGKGWFRGWDEEDGKGGFRG